MELLVAAVEEAAVVGGWLGRKLIVLASVVRSWLSLVVTVWLVVTGRRALLVEAAILGSRCYLPDLKYLQKAHPPWPRRFRHCNKKQRKLWHNLRLWIIISNL